MKKKIYVSILLGVCLVSISACGNKMVFDNLGNASTSSLMEETLESRNIKESRPVEESEDTEESRENAIVWTERQYGFDELEEVVSTDVETVISALKSEYEELAADVDTYEKYLENTDKVEAFYEQVCEDTLCLCIRMREYSINYAEEIMASDKSNRDKYKDLEEIYDRIYDDAGDDIYDEIYDGILDDMYDDFYDGILDDAYDSAPYDEWSDARSDEYDWWSDARSDVYDEWSDFRSDVYDFWTDVRGELWDDDIERAEKKIVDFREDIEKMKRKYMQGDEQASNEEESSDVISSDIENEEANADEELVDGMRPEFKEAMDSYEAFYDEYCDIIKKYTDNPSDMKLFADYTEMLTKAAEMTEKFDAWENNDMNNAEIKYYLEVNNRVIQKVLDASE